MLKKIACGVSPQAIFSVFARLQFVTGLLY